MSGITASAVKELRERTGAGMMDCKKALTEAEGNMEAAIDWLRAKGLAAAAKKVGRTAAEGLVGLYVSGTEGAVVEVNAETDFVGRNEKFQAFVAKAAELSVSAQGDVEKLKTMSYPGATHTVQEELTHLISVIGENMNLRRAKALKVQNGVVTKYVHNAIEPGRDLGRVGVLVALESTADPLKLETLGRQIAMHIAAAHPQSNTIADLDSAVVDRERKIFEEQALASGKKPEFVEKMVEGRLRKFYEESVLQEQIFLIDDSKRKVSQVVSDAAKDLGVAIQLKGFAHFKLGDGIEVEEKDFAAEVAEQLGK